MPKPIVEALILVETVAFMENGAINLLGLYPPRLPIGHVPAEITVLPYIQLRGVQSRLQADRLEFVITYGLEGREWTRCPVFSSDAPDEMLSPEALICAPVPLPPIPTTEATTLVFRLLYDKEEIARTSLEFFEPCSAGA